MLRVPGTNLDLVLFSCFYLRAFWFVMGKSLANLMSIRCTPQGMEMSLTQSEDVRAAEIPLGSSSITVVPPLAPPAPLPAAEAVPTEELQGPGPSVDPKVSSPKHTSAQDSSPLPLPHVFSGSKLFLVKGMRSPERYVPPHMRARTQPTEVCSSAPAVVRVGRGFPPQCHVDFGFISRVLPRRRRSQTPHQSGKGAHNWRSRCPDMRTYPLAQLLLGLVHYCLQRRKAKPAHQKRRSQRSHHNRRSNCC